MKIRFLSAQDVRRALPMSQAVAGMKAAYASVSTGQAVMPLRSHVSIADRQGTTLVMPAYLPDDSAPSLAVKVVSVFPQNAQRGEPVIYGLVMALDAATGRPLAIMEGSSLTAIRTGAASGAATDVLAREDTAVAAIFGSGVQARTQLEAVCTVRAIREVRIFSLVPQQAIALAAEMAGQGPIPTNVRVVDKPETAVRNADVICTATTSNTPVFDGLHLTPGAHINGVGAYLPTMQEIDVATVRRALVVVDSRTAVLAEAGDLIIPLQNGDIAASHIHAELGEIVTGLKTGRTDPQQITFFKSVGLAAQDAVAARIVLRNALDANLGTEVEL
ncbi:MAG: ornithine cyclodeaminase family protein [Chloroflexi bacterium]|nr:ornithine cyclodeaminase family protein [Chloroflexota bacterium]